MKRRIIAILATLLLAGPALGQSGLWVTIGTPASGATVNGPFMLTGTSTPYQRIQVGGSLQGQTQSDGTGNWSVQLDPSALPSGQPFQLNVVAMDGAGHTSAPAQVTYAVVLAGNPAATPLQLSVNLPANGATVPDPFVLSGTATPGMLVDVTGGLRGQTYAGADGTWSLSLGGGTPGQVVNLSVVAREGSGQRSRPVNLRYALAAATVAPAPPSAPPAPPQPRLIVKVLTPQPNTNVGSVFQVAGIASQGTRVDVRAVPVGSSRLYFESTVAGADQHYQVVMRLIDVPRGTPVDLYVQPQDGTSQVIKFRVTLQN